MTILTSLSHVRLAGKLCKLGAWIMAAMWLAVIVLFHIISNVSNDQANPGPNFNELFTTFTIMLLMAIPVFFFSLSLYAVGTLLDYISTEKNREEEVDEHVEITS